MKPPNQIYLQWYGDQDGLYPPDEPTEIHDGITWSADRINDSDAEYMRVKKDNERCQ